jgi:REP element-mobilizing transposase RayT
MYSQPLTYLLTWTCYGTWLPGDDRGWTKWQQGEVIPQPLLADWCRKRMNETPVVLGNIQRKIVHDTIKRHCELRSWKLHAVNCRSNHCHVVVTANSHDGEQVRDQFKSWCSRTLSASATLQNMASYRDKWWTRKGSVRYLFDEDSLAAAIQYTFEAQDVGGSRCEG